MTEGLGFGLRHAVHPLTWETVELASASDEALARFLDDIRDSESRLKEAKKLASREILRRMESAESDSISAGKYTLRAEGERYIKVERRR